MSELPTQYINKLNEQHEMANPTAEMPMPGDQEQQDLLDVLEKHDSLYQLSLEMPKLAKSLL